MNDLALNDDGVLVSGGDNGSLWYVPWPCLTTLIMLGSLAECGEHAAHLGLIVAANRFG